MPRTRIVVWAPRANDDLKRIWRYYARVASLEVADRIVREIAQAAERLGRHPLPGRERNELRMGLRSLLVHPHTLFFRIIGDEAQVARIVHERRDFPTALKDEQD